MVWSGGGQLADSFNLLVGQRIGQDQPDYGKQVAMRIGIAQMGHPLAAQAETSPGVGPGWNLQYHRPLHGGDVGFAASNSGKYIDRRLQVQVISFTLEGVIGQYVDDQI